MSTPHQYHRGDRAAKQTDPERWINRLTVFGPNRELKKFLRSRWKKRLRGRFWLLQESLRTRFGCQFETEASPIPSLEALSRIWPHVVLILEFENETRRVIGLAKAKAGKLEQFQVRC